MPDAFAEWKGPPTEGMTIRENLGTLRGERHCRLPAHLSLPFSLLMEGDELGEEALGIWISLSGLAVEAHEREMAVRSSMFGFAVGEAGGPAEASPVGGAGIGTVAASEGLCGESAKELRQNGRVFQACLRVAGAGLDDGAGSEAVRRESGATSERFVEPVKRCWPDGRT